MATVRALIEEGGKDPRVIQLARRLVAPAQEMNPEAEIGEIFNYVRRGVRYTQDPYRAETLTDAPTMLEEITLQGRAAGDCDDHVILLGSLLEAVGYPVEAVVESYRKDRQPSHITLKARAGGRWIHLDPTVKDKPMETWAGNPARVFSEKELAMRVAPAVMGLPVHLGEGGAAEATTGKTADSAWGDFFSGLTGFGDWMMTTPIVKNWVMGEQIKNAQELGKLSKKFGYDVYAAAYGSPADVVTGQTEQRTGAPTIPSWVIPTAILGGLGILAMAVLGGRRRR